MFHVHKLVYNLPFLNILLKKLIVTLEDQSKGGGLAMDESKNQTKENETSSPMLSRSAQILQAASPYLDIDSKQMLESVVHITDFFETIQNIRHLGFSNLFRSFTSGKNTVSIANLAQAHSTIDSEALLRSIRPFCTPKEGTMIDQIMNIFNMQRMFSMYQSMTNMMSMMNSMNGTDSSGNFTNNMNPFSNMSGDMSQAMNMAMMMSQMMNSQANSNPTTNSSDSSCYDQSSEEIENSNIKANSSENFNGDTYWNSQNMNYRHSNTPQEYEDNNSPYSSRTFDNNDCSDRDTNYNANNMNHSNSNSNNGTFDNNERNPNSSNNNANSNMQMLDMLSALIPPEQKNTLEAMKIIMESGMLNK